MPSLIRYLLVFPYLFCSNFIYASVINPVDYKVTSTLEEPVVDGDLSDPCWALAKEIVDFTQTKPDALQAPSEKTSVKILAHESGLYIGFSCFVEDMETLRVKDLSKDSKFSSDDFVSIVIDTFNRQRDGYFFSVNPLGAKSDGVVQNHDEVDLAWDAIWDAKTLISENVWTVEIKIPSKSISFDPHSDLWGLNIERLIRHRNEVSRWKNLDRTYKFASLSRLGTLSGSAILRQGYGIEVRPYVTVKKVKALNEDRDYELDAGVEAVWNITPALAAALSINTDFAESDVDERKVNLSRFPLFFPEKRDFFLRDAPLFLFGGLDDENTPFFSRRIGRAPNGEPLAILGALKLVGRTGPLSVGVLNAVVEEGEGMPEKNLFVSRLRVEVLAESNIGLIVTDGDPTSDGDASLLGFDFNYLNSNVLGGYEINANFWLMGSDSDEKDTKDHAFGIKLDWPNDPFYGHIKFEEWGDDFDPALGFVDRTGVQIYEAKSGWKWYPNLANIDEIKLEIRPLWKTDLSSHKLAEQHNLPSLEIETKDGDWFEAEITQYGDFLEEPDEIQPGIFLPEGYNKYWKYKLKIGTSESRLLSWRFDYVWGEHYDGDEEKFYNALQWRPSPYFFLELSYYDKKLFMPEDTINVRITELKTRLSFSPDLSFDANFQYDNISQIAGVFARMRWTIQPGNDIFLVLNQSYLEEDDDQFDLIREDISMKGAWTYRF